LKSLHLKKLEEAVRDQVRRIVFEVRKQKILSKKDEKRLYLLLNETKSPEKPPKVKVKQKTKYPAGSWSERRKELGYSAKDSLTNNPALLKAYNEWKAEKVMIMATIVGLQLISNNSPQHTMIT
jgi:hypothetical protein